MENLTIKVYGSGCKGCQTLHQNVIDALAEMNIAADVQYITDMQKIMETGVMGLPALAVNDKIVSSGKVLSVADVKKYLGQKMNHKEKCGSYICNDLLGCDITSEEGHQFCVDNKLFTDFCPKMVAAAVDIVEEIIQEQKRA